MTEPLNESAIIREFANAVSHSVGKKVIRVLQQMTDTMSGDDSELKTTWDEICAQIQFEQSIYWDVYDETVQAIVRGFVEDLTSHQREAVWLQTDTGSDWSFDDPEDREPDPVELNDIIQYITNAYVYDEAGRWSNARIRAFIDRSCSSD